MLLYHDMSQRFKYLQSNGACTLFTAVMVLTCACTQAPSLQSNNPGTDSLALHINSPLPYSHLDLFVFEDTLTRALVSHSRTGSASTLHLPAEGGYRLAVAIANARAEFRTLPASFDTMEKITMEYADEDPSAPMLAGYCPLQDSRTVEMDILPLLCPISIGEFSIEADAPLEDAVVQLVNANARAEILRSDGFHPSITLDSPESLRHPLMMLQEFPFDIGNRPQDAGITLWCYPNEDEDGPGGRCTTLRISGRIRGELKEYHIPLGPIHRGKRIEVSHILLNLYDLAICTAPTYVYASAVAAL